MKRITVVLLFGLGSVLFASCSALACAGLASCSIDPNLRGGNDQDYDGSRCWMKGLADDVPLRMVVMPGTHDTCANFDFAGLSSTAAAQDLTLSEQLAAGVRVIDIRPYIESDGSVTIHHGVVYQHMSYKEAVRVCCDFLDENPSEALLFRVYNENRIDETLPLVAQAVRDEMESEPSKWLPVNSDEAWRLTVGESRGKLILMQRNVAMEDYLGYGVLRRDYDEKGAYSNTTDANGHFLMGAAALLSNADNPPERLCFVNFAGYFKGEFGIPNIRIVSSAVNQRLESFLEDYQNSSVALGSIICDHITKRLAHKIYSVNRLDKGS